MAHFQKICHCEFTKWQLTQKTNEVKKIFCWVNHNESWSLTPKYAMQTIMEQLKFLSGSKPILDKWYVTNSQ